MENQPETKPDYFIQIPPEVLFEPRLSSGAKLLYGEILFLTHNYGFCSQKNAYFSANHHVCVKTVNNWIHELKTLDLIKIELIRNQNKEVELRKIFALVQIDQSKGPAAEESATQVANRECIVPADSAPKPQVTKPKKKVYGVNQNVFFTENEVAELLKKITQEQFNQAVARYSDWKLKSGANPRSDFVSIEWAVRDVLNPAAKTCGRMTAVQASGCDEVTDETLENLPF